MTGYWLLQIIYGDPILRGLMPAMLTGNMSLICA